MHDTLPFWKTKTLDEMTPQEWESLCDGCGRCCLIKLEEDETGKVYFTDVSCHMLDRHSCQCSDYADRRRHVPDCVTLTPQLLREIDWLPPTCAYKLVERGEDLYWWHYLVSGDRETVHQAGVSVRGKVAATDKEVGEGNWEQHLVRWPMRVPKSAARKRVTE